MKFGLKFTIAAALILSGAYGAAAEPMKCSGEQKACTSVCARVTGPAVITACLERCRSAQKSCMQTGCWDNGSSRYCGLMKQ
jgi:hypothetical protein